MDIAVQVTPQKEPKTTEESVGTHSVEDLLVFELENMFKRENLQNNSYLIYRMNNSLEVGFDVILNENKIKSICQDGNLIISALKKAKNLKIDEQKKNITPIIPTQKNKIIISNVETGEEEELKKFLLQGTSDNDCDFVFDRKNCCRVVFKDDAKTDHFFTWVTNQKFKNRSIHAYFEPENLYITFLQNIQEKKQSPLILKSYHKPTTTSMPYYGAGAVPPYPPFDPAMYAAMMDPNLNPYLLYPPYGFDPYRFMPPPYYTNFFIRKANDEEGSDEEREEGHEKAKYYEKREKYYPRDYDYGHQYKSKPYRDYDKGYDKPYDKGYDRGYDKNYEKGGYYGKPSYNSGYEHAEKGGKGRDYKEKDRKPYDATNKKGHQKGKNKPHTPGQKYYYEPKQVKVDAENFPPLIVKEEKTIEVTVVNPELIVKIEAENKSTNSYTKKEIVEIFKKVKAEKKITMNPALENPHEDVVHLVEKEGDIRLEYLDPKAVKILNSTNTTPLMTGMSRPPVIMEEKKE